MPSRSHYRIAVAVASSGALTAFFLSKSDRFRAHASSRPDVATPVHVELYDGEERRRRSNWDQNWDRMAPRAVQPKDGKEEKEIAKSTASRYLICIRHGQFERWHSDHDKRVLTELGRRQARATGTVQQLNICTYNLCHAHFALASWPTSQPQFPKSEEVHQCRALCECTGACTCTVLLASHCQAYAHDTF